MNERIKENESDEDAKFYRKMRLSIVPVQVFLEECCKIHERPAEAIKHQVPKNLVFEAYTAWCKENNLRSESKISFGIRLHHLEPFESVLKKQIMRQGERFWIYEGLEILSETYRKYLKDIK